MVCCDVVPRKIRARATNVAIAIHEFQVNYKYGLNHLTVGHWQTLPHMHIYTYHLCFYTLKENPAGFQ